MSATNRNGLARQPNDFYETPAWAVDAVLDVLGITDAFDGYVVDPGCGNGAIASRVAQRAPKADVRGIEKDETLLEQARSTREASIAWELGDWLSWQADGVPDLVIGNPPYKLADDFVKKALAVTAKKGIVAMLLRSTFLVPKARRELRKLAGLPNKFELERRPSFNGSGTDATEYAWIVWSPKGGGRWSVIEARDR